MKKFTAFLLLAALIFALSACANAKPADMPTVLTETPAQTSYKVEIEGNFPIANTLKKAYSPGENVTIQLPTFTDGYYKLYTNGTEVAADSSDMEYTCFTFSMPDKDVLVKIEEISVDIPGAPNN